MKKAHTFTHTYTHHYHDPKIKAETRRHHLTCAEFGTTSPWLRVPSRLHGGGPGGSPDWRGVGSSIKVELGQGATGLPRGLWENQKMQLVAEHDPPPPLLGWRRQARWCSVSNPICRPLLHSQVPHQHGVEVRKVLRDVIMESGASSWWPVGHAG